MKTNRLALILTIVNLALLIFILVKGSLVSASLTSNVIRASVIELVDQNGEVRAQLKTEPDGQVVLRLRDQDGTIRVKLGADTGGSGLVLLNSQTEPGIQLLVDQEITQMRLAKDGVERVIEP